MRRAYIVDGDEVDLAALETIFSYINTLEKGDKSIVLRCGVNHPKFFDQNGLPLGEMDENGLIIPKFEDEPIAMVSEKGMATVLGN